MHSSFNNKHLAIIWRFLLTLSIAGLIHTLILLLVPDWQPQNYLPEPKTLDITLSSAETQRGTPELATEIRPSPQSVSNTQAHEQKKALIDTEKSNLSQIATEQPTVLPMNDARRRQRDATPVSDDNQAVASSASAEQKSARKVEAAATNRNASPQKTESSSVRRPPTSQPKRAQNAITRSSVSAKQLDANSAERVNRQSDRAGSETQKAEDALGGNERTTEDESYIAKIQRIIKKNRLLDFNIYSGTSSKQVFRTRYRIKLLSNGAVIDVRIIEMGARRDFALRGRRAIIDSSPFPPPPAEDAQKGFVYEIGMVWIEP